MALDPTRTLASLTQAECAQLRNDLLAMSDLPAGATIRRAKKLIRIGADKLSRNGAAARIQTTYQTMQTQEQTALAALQAQLAAGRAQAQADQDAITAIDATDYGPG